MECGDMKTLSGPGLVYQRACNLDGARHLACPPSSAIATPRSQSTSTASTHATPRDTRHTPSSTRYAKGGYELGDEDLGEHLPAYSWTFHEKERALSPRTRQSPRVGKRLTMASRDKESLLEEIIQLKKVLLEQANTIRKKNAQNNRIGYQNRKLEMDVEDLETSLQLDGPRTGNPNRMRAKLQGLQMLVEELQDTCDAQREELFQLRSDIRVTRTREIEVERDVFAQEIIRLHKVLRRMQHLQNRISCENRDLGRLKNKYQQLEIANLRLENCMTATAIRPQSVPQSRGSKRPVQHVSPEHHPVHH